MTIKNRILSAIAIFVFNFSIAQAQTFDKGTAYWGLYYYEYKEPSLSVEMKNKWIPSLLLGYRDDSAIRGSSKNALSYFAEGAIGYTYYKGSGESDNYYYKFNAEALYPLPYNFYLGLGYRWLYDDGGGKRTTTGAYGYDRQNQLLYVPVGYVLKNTDGSSAKFQFNYLIEGQQDSYLSDVAGYADIRNKQKDGYGLDLSYMPAGSKWEIFAKYWNIDTSTTNSSRGSNNITLAGTEPKNKTIEIGFKLAF
jgi:hypothetical protein